MVESRFAVLLFSAEFDLLKWTEVSASSDGRFCSERLLRRRLSWADSTETSVVWMVEFSTGFSLVG